jgi:hypothetical protein
MAGPQLVESGAGRGMPERNAKGPRSSPNTTVVEILRLGWRHGLRPEPNALLAYVQNGARDSGPLPFSSWLLSG